MPMYTKIARELVFAQNPLIYSFNTILKNKERIHAEEKKIHQIYSFTCRPCIRAFSPPEISIELTAQGVAHKLSLAAERARGFS